MSIKYIMSQTFDNNSRFVEPLFSDKTLKACPNSVLLFYLFCRKLLHSFQLNRRFFNTTTLL